ncbi:MAG: ATP-binding protein [Thermoleophilia bacterium]|nr:ATP-binding protein [Thermoleophilia bacterium]
MRPFVDGLSTAACYVKDNRVVMNAAARELLGLSSTDELALDEWFNRTYGNLSEHARMLYSLHRSLGLSQPITLPATNGAGRQFWLQLSFHTSGEGEVWFLSDIGLGMERWSRLTDAEARWQALVESLPGWVTQVDLDGTIKWISRAPDGRSPSQVLGHNIAEFLRLKGHGDAVQLFSELVSNPRTVSIETDEMLPDGRHVYHEHYVGPLMDQEKCVGFVVHSVDVTERHRREQQLREQQFQLFQARKMEALGRMAGGVAHDLNNLLAVISGNLELLAKEVVGTQSAADGIADMRRAVAEATELVRALLAMSRGQKLNRVQVDLAELLRRLERLLRSQIGPNVSLVLEISPDVPTVVADISQLSQVVTNLVLNARDAMPEGGALRIAAQRLVLDSELATGQGIVPLGIYALLHVIDTGCGMDREVQEHLFEPFFSTKKHGTGLGLAVVYSIVQQSGGYIWFETEVGKGTAFHVALPAVE